MRDLPEYRIRVTLEISDSDGNDITVDRTILTDVANDDMSMTLLRDCLFWSKKLYFRKTAEVWGASKE